MIVSGPKNLAEHLARIEEKHKTVWDAARRRTEAGAAAVMSPEALLAEGRRMARPAVLLVKEGNEYAAVWGGGDVVPPPPGKWGHCISIDARFLPENPRQLRGVLSIYLCREDADRSEEVGVVHDPAATLPAQTDGLRLFAERVDCVPTADVLFKLRSKPIQDWLATNSVDPNHRHNPASFGQPNRPALKAYSDMEVAEHPFWGNTGAYAMLGGWSHAFLECYGMNEDYPWHVYDMALVVVTVQGQPLVEVFDDGKQFVTFSRLT